MERPFSADRAVAARTLIPEVPLLPFFRNLLGQALLSVAYFASPRRVPAK